MHPAVCKVEAQPSLPRILVPTPVHHGCSLVLQPLHPLDVADPGAPVPQAGSLWGGCIFLHPSLISALHHRAYVPRCLKAKFCSQTPTSQQNLYVAYMPRDIWGCGHLQCHLGLIPKCVLRDGAVFGELRHTFYSLDNIYPLALLLVY